MPLPILAADEKESVPQPDACLTELIKRGIATKAAAELVQKHPTAFIVAKLEEFDWVMSQAQPPKRPAGYLVKSIKDGYATPEGFVSKAEQQQKAAAAQQRHQAEADHRRHKQLAELNERRLAEKVKLYQQSRTPEELARLEAAAISGASEDMRRNLNDPTMLSVRKSLISGLLREHIARVIEAEEKSTESA
jgi:hypothetical protein